MKKKLLVVGVLGIVGLGLYGGTVVNGWQSGYGDDYVYMPEGSIRSSILTLIERNTLVETEDGSESLFEIEKELPTVDQIKKYAYSDPNQYLELGELSLSGIQGIQHLGENVKKIRLSEIGNSDITPIFLMEHLEELDLEDANVTMNELDQLFTSNRMPKLKVLHVRDYEYSFKDFSDVKIPEKFQDVLYRNSTTYPTITLSSDAKELVIKNPIQLSNNNGGETTYTSQDKNFKVVGNELRWDLSTSEEPKSFTWEYKLAEPNRNIVFNGEVRLKVLFED